MNTLDRGAQADLAAAMKIDAGDFASMRAEMVAEKFSGLSLQAREQAFERFEASEAAFGKWTSLQKSAFADVLGAKALERAVLQTNSFNRLGEAQQLAVWANLGRAGQEAALRYAGFEADLARGPAMQRQQNFDRYMQERFARN